MHGPEAAIYVYNEGKEDYMQVFAQMTKRDGSFLVSRKENKDFKWTDLKGSTIIPGRKGGVPYMTFEYVLKQSGLDTKKDVILDDSIKFDLMAGAFAGGKADYVTLFEPTASMTEAQEKGYIVASVGEAGGEIPYTAYFAKKSYINNNKDIIQGFTNAVYKGQTWVKEHTAKEIAEHANKGNKDAMEVYQQCGKMLGQGLAVLIDLLNPERIILGSVYVRSKELLLDTMWEVLQRECLPKSLECCQILPSGLGEKLGDVAALTVAAYGMDREKKQGINL